MRVSGFHIAPLRHLLRLGSTNAALLMALWLILTAYIANAQSGIPIKDYSVGNKFVYGTYQGSFLSQEEILGDTLLQGKRYAVVEIRSNAYPTERVFMRSTDSAIYQYNVMEQREYSLYNWGQWCSVLNARFSPCGHDNFSRSPLILVYGNSTFDATSTNVGFARYVKPYGLLEYKIRYDCRQEYFPGHLTRPPQYSEGGWSTVCSFAETKLISGIIQGKPIDLNKDARFLYLSLKADTPELEYEQTKRLSLRILSSINDASVQQSGITSVQCQFSLDTALLELVSIGTIRGNRTDSTLYRDGKMLLYCSFAVNENSEEIGFLEVKSKSQRDTATSLSIQNYSANPPPMSLVSLPLNLSLEKQDSTHIRWSVASPSLDFNKVQRLFLMCTSTKNPSSRGFSDTLKVLCRLTLDTLLVDVVKFSTAKGDKPDSVVYANNRKIIYLSFWITNTSGLGYIDVISKATIDTTILFRTEQLQIQPSLKRLKTSALPLQLKKLVRLALSIQSSSNTASVKFGEVGTVFLGISNEVFAPFLPPKYIVTLDTTGLDKITFFARNTDSLLIPDKISVQGQGKIEYHFLHRASSVNSTVLAKIQFRSKLLQPRENTISLKTLDTQNGIEYIPANYALKQTGFYEYSLSPGVIEQLQQQKGAVQYIAPNPAFNEVTLRCALSTSVNSMKIEILNLRGEIVKTEYLSDVLYGVRDIKIQVGDIRSGMYFLCITAEGLTSIQKVWVSH